MLTISDIRKKTRAYTDKQIISMTDRLVTGSNWWSNGQIILYEKYTGEVMPNWMGVTTTSTVEARESWARSLANSCVYDVQIGAIWHGELTWVMFENDKIGTWVNARMLLAMCKRGAVSFKSNNIANLGMLAGYDKDGGLVGVIGTQLSH